MNEPLNGSEWVPEKKKQTEFSFIICMHKDNDLIFIVKRLTERSSSERDRMRSFSDSSTIHRFFAS